MTASMTVTVVGAGIFGTTAALELRRRGHSVTLLDPAPIPAPLASSTDISKMVRMDYGSDVFYHELAEAALEGWDRWNARWPRPLYHQTGFLVLSAGRMAPGGFEHESWRVLRERGYDPPRLEGGSVSTRFPAWRAESYPDGYVSPRGGWAESGEVVARLAVECRDRGVRIVQGSFEALLVEGSRVRGVRTGAGEDFPAQRVVVATGAWTPTLLPWLSDVMWATGHPVAHVRPADARPFRVPHFLPFAADIAGSGWYGFAATDDGRVKVARHGPGTPSDPTRPASVTGAQLDELEAFFRHALPGLSEAPVVFTRICSYCDTFDGDPWISADAEREGLVVAAGGSGHGFKFAPLLGPLIADAVEGADNRWGARFRARPRTEIRTEEARFDG